MKQFLLQICNFVLFFFINKTFSSIFVIFKNIRQSQPVQTNWDQFSINEKLFGVKTSFDEEIYTTKLDKSSDFYRKNEADAARLAEEITRVCFSSRFPPCSLFPSSPVPALPFLLPPSLLPFPYCLCSSLVHSPIISSVSFFSLPSSFSLCYFLFAQGKKTFSFAPFLF